MCDHDSRFRRAADRSATSDPLELARKSVKMEQWSEAAEQYQLFLRKHPGAPRAAEARFWIGFCLVKAGEPRDAVRFLRPFEALLAESKWADDALLQLGHAYAGSDDNDLALAAWKRLIEKHPRSVWRTEALGNIIYLLFYDSKDYAQCLKYCRQILEESKDEQDAQLVGAFCLNSLRRFDEADKWTKRWFDLKTARGERMRRVLEIQRDLLRGNSKAAFRRVDRLQTDFPELAGEERLETLLMANFVLRSNGQVDRAFKLLADALPTLRDFKEETIHSVLTEMITTLGDIDPKQIMDRFEHLAGRTDIPPNVRAQIRGIQVDSLMESEQPRAAADLLRLVMKTDKSQYVRCEAVLLFADLMTEELDDPAAARDKLTDVLKRLTRRDLILRVQARRKKVAP